VSDPKDRETILYAFAIEPSRDQGTLDRYLAQYPDLADELIDLAFELRFATAQLPSETAPAADTGMQSAWEEFIACAPGKAKPAKAGSFLSKFRGQAFADLAIRLKVPRSILTAFRDRLVEPLSVPERFLCRFAEAAESSLQEVLEYLANPPLVIGTAQFKADKKPSPQGRVTFRHLVESTEMSDEEREELLQGCDDDGRKRS
jgi:hypothetical protein